ncbi:zinc finger protein matrin [Stylonychia lemnae]|uniref:Zinc finger protein matrin n=1 Tax=Stylonychia lemnae TaxID=5949 RepID=A0A078BDX9_STYLE|nr:zinc finger protein matrin [Stylonychia lemnae]|eukprot:CDW91783.1 zinc finger protein matrin [Stylonychia lemnae]
MQSKKPQNNQVRHSYFLNKFQKTDSLGRQILQVNNNAAFQPPKPLEKPPHLQGPTKSSKNGNVPAPEKRKLLQPVDRDIVKPEDIIGKETTITIQTEEEKQSAFFCKTCKVQLKDSNAWYDHINGKKHNQMLGMSMVVEKVGLDRVKAKLAGLKRKAVTTVESIEDIERRLDQQEQEEKDKKNKRKKLNEENQIKERVQEQFEFDEDDISAFGLPSDFGTTKKK